MMGKQSGQIQKVILDMNSMIPEDHLLRRIKNCVNFDFIYEKVALLLFPCWQKIYRSRCSDKNATDWLSLWDQIRAET